MNSGSSLRQCHMIFFTHREEPCFKLYPGRVGRFPRRTPFAGNPGFTLFEVMIVLLILSVTAGLVIPRIGAGWKRMEDREFLQDFTQTLKWGRLRAMNSGQMVVFRINGRERVYDIDLPPQRPIPPNVDIYADQLEQDPETLDHVILFYPDGSLSGGDMEITFDKERAFHISIHPILGTIEYFGVPPR